MRVHHKKAAAHSRRLQLHECSLDALDSGGVHSGRNGGWMFYRARRRNVTSDIVLVLQTGGDRKSPPLTRPNDANCGCLM